MFLRRKVKNHNKFYMQPLRQARNSLFLITSSYLFPGARDFSRVPWTEGAVSKTGGEIMPYVDPGPVLINLGISASGRQWG